MQAAIAPARTKGAKPSDTPIAAIIVRDPEVLSAETNGNSEDHDATAHAEISALRTSGGNVSDMELRGATLYSTLQPCGMCTMSMI